MEIGWEYLVTCSQSRYLGQEMKMSTSRGSGNDVRGRGDVHIGET